MATDRPPRRPPSKPGKARSAIDAITSTGSGRDLKVRVKSQNKTTSSKRWLARQLNDPFVAEAKRAGYRSRAAYKLAEIDAETRILKPGATVVDLGAAPGGWTQIALERLGRTGRVIALDILPMDPVPGADVLTFDFLAEGAPEALIERLGGPADVVLSDMAAPTTGHRETDHVRIVALAEVAIDFAIEVLKPGGAFVCKVFQGGTTGDLLKTLKASFRSVKHVKPKASRAESPEVYVVATGFRGAPSGSTSAGDEAI